jgi:outer membrane lipoprotein-sorting protein
MNDNDLPSDELSQFLFGELDDARRAAVQKAMAEDVKLAADVGSLSFALATLRGEDAGPISDDFNDRLRQRTLEILGSAQPQPIRATFLTRSLTTWRWIMRSRVSRLAAAAVLVLAVIGVGLWFHTGGTTPAWADFLQPIREAKTVKYKMILEVTSLSPEWKLMPEDAQKDLKQGFTTVIMMRLGSSRARTERDVPGQSKTVEIWDGRQGKTLYLYPSEKRADVLNHPDRSQEKPPTGTSKEKSPNEGSQNPLEYYRSLCLDTWKERDVKRESLGEKDFDGRRLVGYRFSCPSQVITVWGDPTTVLPIRVETTMAMTPNFKITMTDFEFNLDMEESLFSMEPPAGYEVMTIQVPPYDRSAAEEKDLIRTLRECSEANGGIFPPSFDLTMIFRIVNLMLPPESGQKRASAKHREESMRTQWRLQRGLNFSLALAPEADAHYAGKGVRFGAVDKPVFWYRPKQSKTYRVVYGDLSIRQTDAPPEVPVARPEDDLIDLFRYYSKSCGGQFPDKLELMSLLTKVYAKLCEEASARGLKEPDAKQTQEYLRAPVRFEPGLTFVVSIPPEADAHYGGKGVSFGAADRPIFWYRPKDARKYRVVYGDLSIRDADTPPKTPVVLPEEDLIELFRYYTRLCGGSFPNSLDLESVIQDVYIKAFMKFTTEGEMKKLSAKESQEYNQSWTKLQPVQTFLRSLPPEADVHYAGRGVPLGAAERPVFWYRPKHSKKYRIVYADLTVRESDSPPNVPVPLPEVDLIDALRCYCELSGGPLPDSLAREALQPVIEKKFGLPKGQKPTKKQMVEFMGVAMKFLPGERFANSLPPDSDKHYAGKGVSLGAADRPIFWYRPKGSKKYRVIYADLTVRDADAPPNMPNAKPLPIPSSPKK